MNGAVKKTTSICVLVALGAEPTAVLAYHAHESLQCLERIAVYSVPCAPKGAIHFENIHVEANVSTTAMVSQVMANYATDMTPPPTLVLTWPRAEIGRASVGKECRL